MELWICVTCGTQFSASAEPPEGCPICLDPRQYLGQGGQKWTTLGAMQAEGFHSVVHEHEPGLVGIGTEPGFAIKQRALLVQSEQGNVLWDCITLLDDEIVATVERLGGLRAIAISHPHYYSSMVEWATRFNVPIYLHEGDRRWVMRPDEHIQFWSGETQPLWDEMTIVRLGGHFSGSCVLHSPRSGAGQGLLLTGDTIQVVSDRRWVSFMFSYPNLIPLPASEVQRIRDAIAGYRFERLYGAWFETIVSSQADEVVQRSAERYIQILNGRYPPT